MKNIYIALLLLIYATPSLCNDYYFSNLSLQNGLSQITVTSIYQDKQGFMWFGTRSGLNLFDGYRFKSFFFHPDDPLSISDNNIQSIEGDNNGFLWVGTTNGLNRYDPKTSTFKRFLADKGIKNTISHNSVTALFFDKEDNILWIGTSNGLNKYDLNKNIFEYIALSGYEDSPIQVIKKYNKQLYIGTPTQGLIIYNLNTKKTSFLKNTPLIKGSLSHNNVRDVLMDTKGNLWVATHHEGVNLMKKGESVFQCYNEENGLTNNYVRCLKESPDGKILAGTFSGINVIDPETNKITQYNSYLPNRGNLSHYSILCIYFDQSNTLWIGTYSGGIDYHNAFGLIFRYFDPSFNQSNIIGIMGAMVETPEDLYFATEGGGILEFNKKTESFRNFVIYNNSSKSFGQNIIKSLYLDGNRILCGTNIGTIYSFDLKTQKFSLFYDLKEEKSIYHVSRNSSGDLIIGSVSQNGLIIVPKDNPVNAQNSFPVKGLNKPVAFLNIRCVLELEKNVYLIGTRHDGLYLYDKNNQTLANYRSNPNKNDPNKLADNYISSIIKDSQGHIWIGTFGGGFCLFNRKDGTFKTFQRQDSFLNNICYIVEDNKANLWISATSGISRFDIKTGKFLNYNFSNGIKISEFSPHSGLKLHDGRIVFSGNNGFTIFDPSRLSPNPFVPPIVLENLYVNNKEIVCGAPDGILKQTLPFQKEIVLRYDQSNIAIEYSALNYIFADGNKYKYKLEGFDDGWNEVGNRRSAYYTNIPPGEYVFRVIGANNDNVWNNEGASIIIKILPPFWKTWWAYTIYVLAVIGLLIFIVRYYTEKRRLENDVKLKQLEAKAQEEFHQERSRLFTNFSHELRTPLTLIMSPLNALIENRKSFSEDETKTLQLMHSNANRLLRLVNNLMDFQKNESKTMSLKISEGDFVRFTLDMTSFFNELAISRKIKFTYVHSVEKINYWFDQSLMEKVYFNFLSNAFKNVHNNGEINVILDIKSFDDLEGEIPERIGSFHNRNIQYITVKIKDSGIGIPQDELEKIFIPFYQVAQNEHASSGTGLGLSLSKSIIEMHHGIVWAESEKNKGAAFTFILPVDKDIFAKNELLDSFGKTPTYSSKIEIAENAKMKGSDTKKEKTILVVEDNRDVRNYIISLLANDYNMLEAHNGEIAINIAKQHLPDLIITDLMMPKMDGMEMTRILKTDLNTSHIPVIMITALATPSNVTEGYETGADDYITKPFNAEILVARVKNIIQSRDNLKEMYGKRFSLESLGIETTSVDERFMQKIYDVLMQNISDPEFNIDKFSKEVGMSKANLYRKIKTNTNFSPNEFIRNYRLEAGAKMLKETDMTVSEVYVAVGFNSLPYFSNCFKVQYGISPTEFTSKFHSQK